MILGPPFSTLLYIHYSPQICLESITLHWGVLKVLFRSSKDQFMEWVTSLRHSISGGGGGGGGSSHDAIKLLKVPVFTLSSTSLSPFPSPWLFLEQTKVFLCCQHQCHRRLKSIIIVPLSIAKIYIIVIINRWWIRVFLLMECYKKFSSPWHAQIACIEHLRRWTLGKWEVLPSFQGDLFLPEFVKHLFRRLLLLITHRPNTRIKDGPTFLWCLNRSSGDDHFL